MNNTQFEEKVIEFLEAFNLVFENDFDYTKSLIQFHDEYNEESKTLFDLIDIDNPSNNMFNLGNLYHCYNELSTYIKLKQLDPK